MNLVRKTLLLMSLVHSLLRFYDKAKYKKVYQLHDYKATEVYDPEAAGEIWIRPNLLSRATIVYPLGPIAFLSLSAHIVYRILYDSRRRRRGYMANII